LCRPFRAHRRHPLQKRMRRIHQHFCRLSEADAAEQNRLHTKAAAMHGHILRFVDRPPQRLRCKKHTVQRAKARQCAMRVVVDSDGVWVAAAVAGTACFCPLQYHVKDGPQTRRTLRCCPLLNLPPARCPPFPSARVVTSASRNVPLSRNSQAPPRWRHCALHHTLSSTTPTADRQGQNHSRCLSSQRLSRFGCVSSTPFPPLTSP